jgi:hypothetical protein
MAGQGRPDHRGIALLPLTVSSCRRSGHGVGFSGIDLPGEPVMPRL